ncbi:hypothetical protein ACIQZG_04455 [Lysinibacillus sp. NPDC096418]|uniref:hypothetical protein n=1 Tax=Lysinibacillus sp. NPDC096418 TaxID=3364138 RepID=UPI0037FBAABF
MGEKVESSEVDLELAIEKAVVNGASDALIVLSAVTGLAELLDEKGIIEYEEFIEIFKERLKMKYEK